MSLGASRSKLIGATKALTQEWRQLETHWRDARYLHFQATVMDPLIAAADDALRALEELDVRITKIRHDCE
jgi:hypothetical protein